MRSIWTVYLFWSKGSLFLSREKKNRCGGMKSSFSTDGRPSETVFPSIGNHRWTNWRPPPVNRYLHEYSGTDIPSSFTLMSRTRICIPTVYIYIYIGIVKKNMSQANNYLCIARWINNNITGDSINEAILMTWSTRITACLMIGTVSNGRNGASGAREACARTTPKRCAGNDVINDASGRRKDRRSRRREDFASAVSNFFF